MTAFYKSRRFQILELVDPQTYGIYGDKCWSFFNPLALVSLDAIKDYYSPEGSPNVSVIVNNWSFGGSLRWRGLRVCGCNVGSPYSQHYHGNAFDCTINGVSEERARQDIERLKDSVFIHITRLERGVAWLHFDCANVPERITYFNA